MLNIPCSNCSKSNEKCNLARRTFREIATLMLSLLGAVYSNFQRFGKGDIRIGQCSSTQKYTILWQTLISAFLILPAMTEETQAEFAAWKERILSSDQKVFDAAVVDLQNGFARDAKAETLVPLFTPIIQNYSEKHEYEGSRGRLIKCMAERFGHKAKLALPVLITLASDIKAHHSLRREAITALGKIGEHEPELIDALIGIIEEKEPTTDKYVQIEAAQVLGDMYIAAERARPALFAMLKDEWPISQDAAYVALGKIAVKERATTIRIMLSRLDHVTELSVEQSSALFLKLEDPYFKNDPRVHAARVALSKIIATQSDTRFQRAAIRVLIANGPGGEPAMARALCKAMIKDQQFNAANLLKSMNVSNPATVQTLVDEMKESLLSEYPQYTLVIAETLLKSGVHARAATPLIIQAMQMIVFLPRPRSGFEDHLAVYSRLLKSIGSIEPTILPALLTMLNPDLPFMKENSRHADLAKYEIFIAIATMELPHEGPLHKEILARVVESLESKCYPVLIGASEVAGKLASAEPVPLLLRIVTAKEETSAADDRDTIIFTRLAAVREAINALGKLGLLAKDTLPFISEVAARQYSETSFFDLKKSHEGMLIDSARKAKAAIEKAILENTQQK